MDMTQKEQELRLKAEDAEQRYKSILESISEACIFVDRDWRISYANTQAARVFRRTLELSWAAISGKLFLTWPTRRWETPCVKRWTEPKRFAWKTTMRRWAGGSM